MSIFNNLHSKENDDLLHTNLPVEDGVTAAISLSSPSMSSLSSFDHPRTSALGSRDELNIVKCEVMVNWLHLKQQERRWIDSNGAFGEGVFLKRSKGIYVCAPIALAGSTLETAVRGLHVKVAMTINTTLIKILLRYNFDASFIEVQYGLRLQLLPDVSYLPRCQKHQFAAFISNPGLLVVWEDQPSRIINRVEKLELALVQMIWGTPAPGVNDDQQTATIQDVTSEVESGDESSESGRGIVLVQPVASAATLALAIAAIAAGWRQVALEIAVDRTFLRVAFLLSFLPQIWCSLFFFQCVVGNISQFIGPIGQYKTNTKFFSAKPPKRLVKPHGTLPHVTIQCPVYKEGLQSVIEPTITSVKAAISTYEMQGGSANIFINDDGMQLMAKDVAHRRREFYEEHNIGWIARPKHNPNPDKGETLFVRRGKFKKASNMNYALWASQRVEDKLTYVSRTANWTQDDEMITYQKALTEVISEDEGRTWGDGNIRMGDYILIIDSDTRVPEDCLLDAVSEMEQSPQVAIMQYSSGVMNVTDSFFERGITFFTNLIYTAIRYAVANGDVAPFVGHNAILRWSAVQEVAYDCHLDKQEKYWSEDTVSEDFDMALRLQTAGYVVRLAAYTGNGFQEGVSLTVYDELARWEKYAYGCNELIFHPIHQWLKRGPFTRLFRRFIVSKMPLHSKLTILAYIGTYYALGSAWILTVMNYFILGLFNGYYDHYYIDSWKIIVAIWAVFIVGGNVALAVFRYRVEEKPFIPALMENFKWIPLLFIFFGGISLHVSQAILSHMFAIDMTWGATSKEVEDISFFDEIPRVMKRFKGTFVFCFGLVVLIVVMAYFAPYLWRIDSMIAVFPLCLVVSCHFLLPIVLNPNLMLFTW